MRRKQGARPVGALLVGRNLRSVRARDLPIHVAFVVDEVDACGRAVIFAGRVDGGRIAEAAVANDLKPNATIFAASVRVAPS